MDSTTEAPNLPFAGPTGLSGKEILLGSPSSHKLFVADTMQPWPLPEAGSQPWKEQVAL